MHKVIKKKWNEREISETRSKWKETQNKFSVRTLTCKLKKEALLVKRSPLRWGRVSKQRWDNNNRKEWDPRFFTSFWSFSVDVNFVIVFFFVRRCFFLTFFLCLCLSLSEIVSGMFFFLEVFFLRFGMCLLCFVFLIVRPWVRGPRA